MYSLSTTRRVTAVVKGNVMQLNSIVRRSLENSPPVSPSWRLWIEVQSDQWGAMLRAKFYTWHCACQHFLMQWYTRRVSKFWHHTRRCTSKTGSRISSRGCTSRAPTSPWRPPGRRVRGRCCRFSLPVVESHIMFTGVHHMMLRCP